MYNYKYYYVCWFYYNTINIQSYTQIIRLLARFYSYDYDLRKTNYIFK